jgi:hypothetical protein
MALIDVGVRIQALAYLELGYTPAQIEEVLGVLKSVLYRFRRTVIERGYKPQESKKILLEYLVNTPRSSRPTKVTQAIEDSIISTITKNSITRSLTKRKLGLEFGLSCYEHMTVQGLRLSKKDYTENYGWRSRDRIT